MALYLKQPAYKIYAFERGWKVMGYVTKHLFQSMHQVALGWFHYARTNWARRQALSGPRWFVFLATLFRMVFVAGVYVAGAAQYLSAMLVTALFLCIQTLVLGVWAGLSYVMIALLAVYTFTYSRFYRIRYRCQNCHESMDIPVFICPDCQEKHTRLWPSIYGVFTHRCAGNGGLCERRLPAVRLRLFFLQIGRAQDELVRRCPHPDCNALLPAVMGQATNVHFPVVGGPGAGKSSMILSATRSFQQMYQNNYGYTVEFAEKSQGRQVTLQLERLDRGEVLQGTKQSTFFTSGYNLKIQAPRVPVPNIAYIYDAPGEAYIASSNTAQQTYFKYAQGIIFVVDPFNIYDYRQTHEDACRRYEAQGLIGPPGLDASTVYERMFTMFEESAGLRKGKRFSHPMAVVVSKADALDMEGEIGAIAARLLMRRDPRITSEEDALNQLVRAFLCRYGLDNFVRNLELQFAHVRYFSCSALGRMPWRTNHTPFVPARVEDPLIWLLAEARAIKPRARLDKKRGAQKLPPITIQNQQRQEKS